MKYASKVLAFLAWLIVRARPRGVSKAIIGITLGALVWIGWREVGEVTLKIRPSVGISPLLIRVEGKARGRGVLRVEARIDGWDGPLMVMERDLPDDPEMFVHYSEVWLLEGEGEWTLRACVIPKGPCRETRAIVVGDSKLSSSLLEAHLRSGDRRPSL